MSVKMLVDGELEEGEIADESFSKVNSKKIGDDRHKCKKLPKRYMLNSPNELKKKRKHECSHTKKHGAKKCYDKNSSSTVPAHRIVGLSRSQTSLKNNLDKTRNTTNALSKKEIAVSHTPGKQFKSIQCFSNMRDRQGRHAFDGCNLENSVKLKSNGKKFYIFDTKSTPLSNKKRLDTSFRNFCLRSKTAHFDTNSSYEDLLAQYKCIKYELDSMKQTDKCKKIKDTENKNCVVVLKNSTCLGVPTIQLQDEKHAKITTSPIKNQIKETPIKYPKSNLVSNTNCKAKLSDNLKDAKAIGPDEDDDLQVLRRNALASLPKTTISSIESTHSDSNRKSNIPSENCLKSENSSAKHTNIPKVIKAIDGDKRYNLSLKKALSESKCSDNYELVDMDIDSEEELNTLNRDICSEKSILPSLDTPSSSICSPESTHVEDDEVDEELLRAELILSLGRKRPDMCSDNSNEESSCKSVENPDLEMCKAISPPLEANSDLLTVSEANLIEGNDNSCQILLGLESVTEPENLHLSNKSVSIVNEFSKNVTVKRQLPVNDNIPLCFKQEPLVIRLQDDSSSEDSDSDKSKEDSVNAIASLELLVRHARNKSSSSLEKYPSEAVACLSKAQQQEYNKLREIIAQKESLKSEPKLPSYSLQDLVSLEKKLNLARAILKKRNEMISALRSQAAKERIAYKKYLLNVARLKEQLQAADMKKKKGFQSITFINSRIRDLKTGCDKHLSLITDLEKNCKKLGFHILGANYKVPLQTVIAAKIIKKKS